MYSRYPVSGGVWAGKVRKKDFFVKELKRT